MAPTLALPRRELTRSTSPQHPLRALRAALSALILLAATGVWSTTVAVAPARAATVVPPCATNFTTWTATRLYSPGTFCLVSSADYLIFQTDGNFVWYVSGVPLWSSVTAGTGQTLALQGDGNVVVYSAGGQPLYASSWGSILARFAMGTTPALEKDMSIFYGAHTHSVSQTAMVPAGGGFPMALSGLEFMDLGSQTNCTVENRTIYMRFPGRVLDAGQFCWSTDNGTLVFQSDGNLVEYVAGQPRWSTGTWGRGARLAIQTDGNLVIYNAAGTPIWALSFMIKNFSARDLTHGNGWMMLTMGADHTLTAQIEDASSPALSWKV
jgi:hypothetical protein